MSITMPLLVIILVGLALASLCYAQQAFVQPKVDNCYAYEVVVAALARYGETSTGPTLVDGTAVEVFINRASRSFTTVEVYPNGLTCYRSFGNSWGAQPKNMLPL